MVHNLLCLSLQQQQAQKLRTHDYFAESCLLSRLFIFCQHPSATAEATGVPQAADFFPIFPVSVLPCKTTTNITRLRTGSHWNLQLQEVPARVDGSPHTCTISYSMIAKTVRSIRSKQAKKGSTPCIRSQNQLTQQFIAATAASFNIQVKVLSRSTQSIRAKVH